MTQGFVDSVIGYAALMGLLWGSLWVLSAVLHWYAGGTLPDDEEKTRYPEPDDW